MITEVHIKLVAPQDASHDLAANFLMPAASAAGTPTSGNISSNTSNPVLSPAVGHSAGVSNNEKLMAFCSITLDNQFVIRDLKIISSPKGPFVAMPSRKLMDRCPNKRCSGKNHLRARFCNECGAVLDANRAEKDARGRSRLHADVAHPINSKARALMEERVLQEYRAEVERSKKPGYTPTWGVDADYEAD